MSMYEALVASVLLYRVEIWGWKEHEEVERLHEKYIRWTLANGWSTELVKREHEKGNKVLQKLIR